MSEVNRRWIPSVDAVLRQLSASPIPRPLVVRVVRDELARLRQGGLETGMTAEQVVAEIAYKLATLARSRIQPVINATGIILHTNLGRAPMSSATASSVADIARYYNTLEFDLTSGERGHRGHYLELSLAALCDAAAATVVNNCAAALMLIINTLTSGNRKHVIISRGELVQIGGGFRVPEILQASGAILREVGTTNQTNLDDYRRAIGDDVALILRVHRSNFFMDGFVASPTIDQLATVAREANVPLLDDIGSGALFDTTEITSAASGNVIREPTPAASLAAGASLVCFSGDKLLGGPQAGVIAGDRELIARVKRNPIFRALRCDKLVFAALQSTLDALLADRAAELPLRQLLQLPVAELRARGERILRSLQSDEVQLIEASARVGGGSLPQAELPSLALRISSLRMKPKLLLSRLRESSPPIIATIDRDSVLLNLRTVFPSQDDQLAVALRAMLIPSAVAS